MAPPGRIPHASARALGGSSGQARRRSGLAGGGFLVGARGVARVAALVAVLAGAGCDERLEGEASPPAPTGIASAAPGARGVDSAYRASSAPAPNVVRRGPTPDPEEAPAPPTPLPGRATEDPFAPADPKPPSGAKPGGKEGVAL